MTVEAWSPTPEYTISGTGPYAITHPYGAGAIKAGVRLDTGLLVLNTNEYSVSPEADEVEGNLTLSAGIAATHAGRKLVIDRVTPDEQGWLAVLGEREAGLAAQLDRIVQAQQELRASIAGAARIRGNLDAFDWTDGTVPIRDGVRVKAGPTADQIAGAQGYAEEAEQSKLAAAASAAEALAKQNSMLRWRGAWATATTYAPSDIVFSGGSAYICVIAHTSGVFATDLAATRWAMFAQQGAAGAGTGDMLKTENLSGLANYPLARANLGLGGMAAKANVSFSDLVAAAVRLAAEGLASPSDAELATAAWVAAYVAENPKRQQIAAWDWSTNVASFSLTGLAGWDDIQIYVENLLDTASAMRLRVSFDNGATIQTTGYLGGTNDAVGANDYTDGLAISRVVTAALSGSILLEGMSSAPKCMMSSRLAALGSTRVPMATALAPAGAVNAIRFAGNTITSGKVRVYGLRRA